MARHWSEEVARRHLEAAGYTIVAENYSVRGAELDLVAERGGLIVFVEVKQRASDRYGSPAETISPAKVARLRRAALHYLVTERGRDDLPLRFDAILLSGREKGYSLEHLEAAF